MAFDNHRNFFQSRVAGAFADTVDGHFHLSCAVQHTAHRVGRCHAQVVVAVGRNDGLFDALHVFHQIADFCSIFRRQAVARRVGNVDHRCSGSNYRLDDTCQIFVFGTSCIFRIKFHIVHKAARILNGCHRALNDFLAVGVEFIFDVRIRCADARMYALVFGKFQRFGCYVDIFLHGPCQCTDCWPCHRLGDFDDRIKVTRA